MLLYHIVSAMASLHSYFHFHSCFPSLLPRFYHLRNSYISRRLPASFSRNVRVFALSKNFKGGDTVTTLSCCCKAGAEIENIPVEEENERPPFDINLAVVFAGFAFEAYTTPSDNIGRCEVDAVDCRTVYLSELFVREIFDGQLFVQLQKGLNLPATDPWGTSDPYVILQLDSQVAKSKVIWGTNDPTWNEDFIFNIKPSPGKNFQVAAWDANLVTPHELLKSSCYVF